MNDKWVNDKVGVERGERVMMDVREEEERGMVGE